VSHANLSRFSLVFITAASLALAACSGGGSSEDDTSSSSARSTAAQAVTLNFASDFSDSESAPLAAGETVTITYDASRLPQCRGTEGANPAWSISAFYQVNGGPVSSVVVGGLNPDPTAKPTFTLTTAGDLAIWFENTDVDGCNQYDSAYGKNYHFNVAASANAPGWVGDAQYVLNRETCGVGIPCAQDLYPLDGGFTYDTYVRSQAVLRKAYFEVWKQGVTDFANPNLWQQLDVEIHSRVGSTGDFTTAYVNFDSYDGNNARYAVDLSTLDPLPGGPGGSTSTVCPPIPVSYLSQGGESFIQADLEFYFTVNGTELRPANGTVFHGNYQNYAGLYPVCQ
jgi:hypothetical protein